MNLYNIKNKLKKTSWGKKIEWGNLLYQYHNNEVHMKKYRFYLKNYSRLVCQKNEDDKAEQIAKLLSKVDICSMKNESFFYSVDCFKTVGLKYHILDNYSVDYTNIVKSSFKEISEQLDKNTAFGRSELTIINALYSYYKRCKHDENICHTYSTQLEAVGTLFERPAKTLFEALQRILFFNQFLWQTRHKHNGFGHLDWLLIDLYRKDIDNGILTDVEVTKLIKDFFKILHECCWFKSTMLVGDTGQIIILGGERKEGCYSYNELTYKFIEVSKELKLPDPKVLLRCSSNMPEDLLKLGISCIATGIGAPFLSNDDQVIPALISCGYSEEDAYNYATSACWEPLILSNSCDQNNICTINFADPFIKMLNNVDFEKIKNKTELMSEYQLYLERYLDEVFKKLSTMIFEEDPLFSLLSKSAFRRKKDLLRGGADYNNIGVTSVGMGTVVNSILNIEKLVFIDKEFSLKELNEMRKGNFKGNGIVLEKFKSMQFFYGCDEDFVVEITRNIEDFTSLCLNKYNTYLGGRFKFGLSSPGYITEAKGTEATLDGRKNGEPFSVHISSSFTIPATELLLFAGKLDYRDNRCNGNVVDFFVTPKELLDNIDKYCILIRSAFKNGVYQLQMNVVDSATLIAAKNNPEKHPNLVVRVWGFSAYFKDLPDEYKDLLISRALEQEKKI